MPNALNTQHLVQAGRAPGVQAQNALRARGMAQGNVMRDLAIEEAKYLKSQRPFKRENDAFKWLQSVTPLLTEQNFDEFRDRAIQRGVSRDLLATKDQIAKWATDDGITFADALEQFKEWAPGELAIMREETRRGGVAAHLARTAEASKQKGLDRTSKEGIAEADRKSRLEIAKLKLSKGKTPKDIKYNNAVKLVKTSMKDLDDNTVTSFLKYLNKEPLTASEKPHIEKIIQQLGPSVAQAIKTINEYWGVKGQSFVFKDGKIQEQ